MKRFALFACAAMTGVAQADLLVNGGFEDMPNWSNGIAGDGGYTLLIGNSIPGWTLEADHGATIHNTLMYPTISGNYSLNTDGEGLNGHNVNMYQDFASVAATLYVFTFDWYGWTGNIGPQLDVSIEDTLTSVVLTHGNYGPQIGSQSQTFYFQGTGNAMRLRVKCAPESGYNDNSFIADNFAVQVVPTPGGVAVIALGGLLIGRRRR